jgi:hypothetical protein
LRDTCKYPAAAKNVEWVFEFSQHKHALWCFLHVFQPMPVCVCVWVCTTPFPAEQRETNSLNTPGRAAKSFEAAATAQPAALFSSVSSSSSKVAFRPSAKTKLMLRTQFAARARCPPIFPLTHFANSAKTAVPVCQCKLYRCGGGALKRFNREK